MKGEKLAVSYDNVRSSKEYEERADKEGSYVSVFSNNVVLKTSKSKQDKSIFNIIADIKCPSTYESYDSDVSMRKKTQNNNNYTSLPFTLFIFLLFKIEYLTSNMFLSTLTIIFFFFLWVPV